MSPALDNGFVSVTIKAADAPGIPGLWGHNPFRRWFDELDAAAAARITAVLGRIEQGNLSGARGVGGGVLERRIDSGPGYRVYFGREGEVVVILLGGGTKRRQQRDVDDAKLRWTDYRRRRKREK